MSNLTVENLNRVVQTGDIGAMVGGGGKISEQSVVKEMQNQGMQAPAHGGEGAGSFSNLLRQSVDQVNQDQIQADTAIKELVSGRSKNIHETLLTVERADTS